ncbi:sugar ABC transporter substrate-binding protein [Bacillus sp. J14TS2]|uniref:extracellular solute-binding protein n=1 Tax=Bacillus sp. J14TS2 TaxID=2807188 RepID=UPI001B085675|nr:extracellular solute-binding protein [Bacillus sp. J14TS2]GIN74145.1 sugar ABC transporter substrate-binding protein [Bacillus sp. J14TS2]
MRGRILSTFLIISAIVWVLSGCSKSSNETNAAKSEPDENFNETGLPIVNEEITLTIAGSYDARTGSNWNELETIKGINEGTNVKIDWQLSPSSDWAEKRNLLLGASQDLPDVMLKLTNSDVVQMGSQGVFIPLEDSIDKYAPNLTSFLDQYPEVRGAITAPDGHIYALPLANMAEYKRSDGNTLWINTKWLDKVDMDMPETTEEFKEALLAFKEEGLGLPLTGIYGSDLHGLGVLFGSFGTLDEKFIVKDGKVEFVRASPEYKEVIKYIRSLYEEGLVDQEIFSLESQQLLSKLAAEDEASVGAFFGWSPDQITNPDYNWDYDSPIFPLKGPKGDQATGLKNPQLDMAMFAITKSNANPEATMRWVDRAYEPEMSFMLRQGPNRVEKVDDKYEIIDAPEGYSSGEWRVKETPYNSFVYGFTNEQQEQLDTSNLKEGHIDPDSPEWYELRKPYMEDWVYPKVLFTNEQYKGISRYDTDITDHTDQMAAKWITEGGIDQDWDEYINTLNQMGLEDFIDIYQTAYDTYIENSK